MKTVGIVYHPKNQAAPTMAERVQKLLSNLGVDTWQASAWKADEIREQVYSTDLIVTVGGDGTILRTAHAITPAKTPITGVNLGRLGFLTEINADELEEGLSALIQGKGWIDERAMLEAELTLSGETGEYSNQHFWALNDVVVARGEVARIIHVDASIDKESFATYRADGVILATATGSTGYALAAGGPVMHPAAEDFLLVPILPHLSPGYNLVLPKNSFVELKVSNTHLATLNIDGHISLSLPDGANIKVKHSPHKSHFLRLNPRTSFFSTLEKKLQVLTWK